MLARVSVGASWTQDIDTHARTLAAHADVSEVTRALFAPGIPSPGAKAQGLGDADTLDVGAKSTEVGGAPNALEEGGRRISKSETSRPIRMASIGGAAGVCV